MSDTYKFTCTHCNFNTNNKRNYKIHLETNKHRENYQYYLENNISQEKNLELENAKLELELEIKNQEIEYLKDLLLKNKI